MKPFHVYFVGQPRPVRLAVFKFLSKIDCSQSSIFSVRSSRSSALCYGLPSCMRRCQNYLGGDGGLGGSEKNRGTVITSLFHSKKKVANRREERIEEIWAGWKF